MVANTIKKNKKAIIDRWLVKIKKQVPEAEKHSRPILVNNLEELLDSLAEALCQDDEREVVYRSENHGYHRAEKTKYEIHELVREYRLLKETIFSFLDEKKVEIETRERDGIMYALDQALEQASKVFVQYQIKENTEAKQTAEKVLDEMEEQEVFRERFVATLSHDLKGPLNNITGAVNLLEEHITNSKDDLAPKLLEVIKRSAIKGDQLIHNLLDVNLIQADRAIPIKPSNIDLLNRVNESVALLKDTLRSRIVIESEKEEVKGLWDGEALGRAIDNLVTNALKYGSDSRKVTVRVEQNISETKVAVHNFGNPIPVQKQKLLFQPYFRASNKNVKGWGLGLSLVKGIAEVHGGSVEVESKEDTGTTFTLKISNRVAAVESQ